MPAPNSAVVAVLERNRRIGERMARIVSAAIGLQPVVWVDRPAELPAQVSEETRLVVCGEGDIGQVRDWFFNLYPQLRFAVWTAEQTAQVMALAAGQPRLSNLIGWPRYASMPRPWELAMVARRLVFPDTPAPALSELLHWGATEMSWAPQTSVDRDRVVGEVGDLAARAGVDAKAAERFSAMAHELLMNAMYDAPVDAYGRPRYAAGRSFDVVLDETERPLLRLATDGELLALEVTDPFGGIERQHVFERIARVLAMAGTAAEEVESDDILDTTHGGAGLGMAYLYRGSAALVVDVTRGQATRVTSVHELSASAREVRATAGSLHYFTS
ncbi:hypothetical protein [Haliangium sp.]|uniref:hypothetical protein n=1 Tax=Haliangium sp. TaxID=2663208 RepID=UPI003D119C15